MELRHLRYFLAVADERGFTRAAERLKVAQPAVSAQVRDLEEELGVRLLLRDSHHVELTAAGEIFAEGARSLLQDLDTLVQRARQKSRGVARRLAVGFIGSQSHEWMPTVLRGFRQKFPDVELSLTEIVPSQQLEALLARRLDVGFIGPLFGRVPAGLQVAAFAEEVALAGLPSDHPLARRRTLPWAALRDEPFILTSSQNSPAWREWVRKRCHEAGFTPRVVQEVDRARTGVQYVAAGFGVSVFAEHITRQPAPGVTFVPLRPAEPKIRYGVAWRRGAVPEAVRQFLQYTQHTFAQKAAEGGSGGREGGTRNQGT